MTAKLVGQRFGKLTVLEKAGSINGNVHWYCECNCGTWTLVNSANLNSGNTKSCGCGMNRPGRENGNFKHGGALDNKRSAEYRAWYNMLPSPHVDEWKDFKQFFKDVGWKPSAKHGLRRRDVRKPHGPTNTYWRHPDEQRNLRQQDLGAEFFCDMRAISRANQAAKERERAAA